jgi:hypothetical protein
MSHEPEIDVASYLNAAVSSLTSSTNLFAGSVFDESDIVPAKSVFVLLTGSPEPIAYAGTTTKAEHRSHIQIIVRGGKTDYEETRDLGKSVHEALRFQKLPGYIECRPLQSGPAYIGLDKNRHHIVSLNYELIYEE